MQCLRRERYRISVLQCSRQNMGSTGYFALFLLLCLIYERVMIIILVAAVLRVYCFSVCTPESSVKNVTTHDPKSVRINKWEWPKNWVLREMWQAHHTLALAW